ncbi:AI-2E family transporter [Clostridium sp. Marseille-P299]|uniref:AI-2E family transporter n=1 Tax=Clostridium sp. Marseille-P299 TaxID=1805477 RepID=UPI0009EDFA1C|nr:AI-2E family transporter [Clostridium sp. Marseille-P299]
MELSKNNMKKLMGLILFTVAVYVCFDNVDVVLHTLRTIIGLISPFILGGCIAFIMNVPMRVIERNLFRNEKLKKIKRPVSILLTLIFIIGIIFIVTFVIFPELLRTIGVLVNSIPEFGQRVQTQLTELVKKYPELQKYVTEFQIDWNRIDWEMLAKNILGFAQSFTSNMLSSTIGIVGSIVSGVANFIIGFVFAIYILTQKENLSRQAKKILYAYLPEKRAERTIYIFSLAENTFSNFLSGQCTEAIILGCMFFVAMTIFKFPYALLVGVLIAFTALIPIFGAFIGCFIGAFLILMISPIQALWFIVLFNVLQQIEGNLIYPHVVGGSVGLPSIWVLFAVTVGGNLMGIFGMLIFIPICSVIYALLRTAVNKRLNKREIPKDKFDPKPFLGPKEEDKKDSKRLENLGKTEETKKNNKNQKNNMLKDMKQTLGETINKVNPTNTKKNNIKNAKDQSKSNNSSFTKIDR